MSKVPPDVRPGLQSRLTYANVIATLALFLALGGGAYAAAALPRHSVGTAQLRTHAVSGPKLADHAVTARKLGRGAVTYNRLSRKVRARLDRRVVGVQGPAGERGPAGADALGARRIHFDAPATPSAALSTALDVPGLKLEASCAPEGSTVVLDLQATATEDGVLQASFALDAGTDPAAGTAAATTGSNQNTLVAGKPFDLTGPRTDSGYVRVNARAVLDGRTRTFTLDVYELVDAGTGRCTVGGTATPST